MYEINLVVFRSSTITMTSETNSGKKTSYDDDKTIDFKKLEKELTSAVADEARYWRENDAKFRAVNQKVATYDEFRYRIRYCRICQ